MPEILDAYERESAYFGTVRLHFHEVSRVFEFALDVASYKALRKILESKPLGEMAGVRHRYFFARGYGGKLSEPNNLTIRVRIETERNAKAFDFSAPNSLISNMLWLAAITDPNEASGLKSID